MTSIARFFNKTATVKRLVQDAGNNDIAAYQTVGTIPCHIQQADAEQTALVGGVYGKTWNLWCAGDADIRDNDRVEIDGTAYTIRGVKDRTTIDGALNPHKQAVMFDDLS